MPNPLSKFGLTDLEIAAEMAASPAVLGGLKELMERMVADWQDIAPVFGDKPPHRGAPKLDEPGGYRDSIHYELIRQKDGMPGGRVGTDNPLAFWIEVGTRHMPEYACAAQIAKKYGDTTGPIMSPAVIAAQGTLRSALQRLAGARASGRAEHVAAAKRDVEKARTARSQAFRVARAERNLGRRRGRRR